MGFKIQSYIPRRPTHEMNYTSTFIQWPFFQDNLGKPAPEKQNHYGKTNLDLLEQDSEWQWHQLGNMQICISPQMDNHASTPPLSFLQARCPSCCPTNSIKALKASLVKTKTKYTHN